MHFRRISFAQYAYKFVYYTKEPPGGIDIGNKKSCDYFSPTGKSINIFD
jgi:hypothetical protein